MFLRTLLIGFCILNGISASLAQADIKLLLASDSYEVTIGSEQLEALNIYADDSSRPLTIRLSPCKPAQIVIKQSGMRDSYTVLRANKAPKKSNNVNCEKWGFYDSYKIEVEDVPLYSFSESNTRFELDTFIVNQQGVYVQLDEYGRTHKTSMSDSARFKNVLGSTHPEFYPIDIFQTALESEFQLTTNPEIPVLRIKARVSNVVHTKNNKYGIESDQVVTTIVWDVLSPENRSILHVSSTGECQGVLNEGNGRSSKEFAISEAVKNATHNFLFDNKSKIEEIEARREWEQLKLSSQASQVVDLESSIQSIVSVKSGDNILSGVFINSDGVILTDSYVLRNDTLPVTVTTMDQKEHPATILRKRPELSLMIIQIDVESPYFMNLPSEKNYDLAEKVYAISNPDPELGQSLSMGIISGNRTIDGVEYIQSDVKISPASFGGVLVNSDGTKLYGLLSDKRVGLGVSGLVFSISAETIGSLLKIE